MWHDHKKTKTFWTITILMLVAIVVYILLNERRTDVSGKVVVCIPVYGQSLALGEEAERVTDFDSLTANSNGRIVTERIDTQFGFFDGSSFKQFLKRLLHYRKRSFELSIYGMAESLIQQTGSDTVICTFPGGQGATPLSSLSKGETPYERFVDDIRQACRRAEEGKCMRFYVPAICFMQGESDIADYPPTDFHQLLLQFSKDINRDVKAITHQLEDVRIICYQTNALSMGKKYNAYNYDCPETSVPQTFVNLLRSDNLFWASGPTYPYTVKREYVHINAVGQQCIGRLAALSALDILHNNPRRIGLMPTTISSRTDSTVTISFSVPCPPLVFDTLQVSKASNYGFSVITPQNTDIATCVAIDSCCVHIKCSASPSGCRVRYAVNGDHMKSGRLHGPRGNLRDSQGNDMQANIGGELWPLHNWALQFDEMIGQ
jgi:hypothetical protein